MSSGNGLLVTLYQMTKFKTCPKYKAFLDDKLNNAQVTEFVPLMVENIVKGGKATCSYQHFLFISIFSKGYFSPKAFNSLNCEVNG